MTRSNLDHYSLLFHLFDAEGRVQFFKSSTLKCRQKIIGTAYGLFVLMIKVGKNERVIVSGICGESSSRCLLVPFLPEVL